MDVPINDAMLCWNQGGRAKVVRHPDTGRISDAYQFSVGACFSDWRSLDEVEQRLRLMVEAWHAVAFYGASVEAVHEALLVIPEYRSTLAYDCLPERYRHERD